MDNDWQKVLKIQNVEGNQKKKTILVLEFMFSAYLPSQLFVA